MSPAYGPLVMVGLSCRKRREKVTWVWSFSLKESPSTSKDLKNRRAMRRNLKEKFSCNLSMLFDPRLTLILVLISVSAKGEITFQALEFLSGGNPRAIAFDLSADGPTVVGSESSGAGHQAFRWTAETGMVGLGHLPGGSASMAYGSSSDGTSIVGWGNSAGPQKLVWLALAILREGDFGVIPVAFLPTAPLLWGLATGFQVKKPSAGLVVAEWLDSETLRVGIFLVGLSMSPQTAR